MLSLVQKSATGKPPQLQSLHEGAAPPILRFGRTMVRCHGSNFRPLYKWPLCQLGRGKKGLRVWGAGGGGLFEPPQRRGGGPEKGLKPQSPLDKESPSARQLGHKAAQTRTVLQILFPTRHPSKCTAPRGVRSDAIDVGVPQTPIPGPSQTLSGCLTLEPSREGGVLGLEKGPSPAQTFCLRPLRSFCGSSGTVCVRCPMVRNGIAKVVSYP